ncbi:hypothetical protein [Maridesulfovibrio ferrireducens]|uniref:hypothetical protein n=1 Tax=Maridesulfovibrio ferrireducens TaxID=246191 RepID=UPI001A295DEF|nr:hypothetical protein [Maridesulfovibrio ferrireducens]MBI9112427.1 hypothetical protein [Maridesulfovibrio ferrireducens]
MLMTITEVADLLRTTPGAARTTLDNLKLCPVNLGQGRGKGLRWYRSEILTALDDSRKSTTPKKRPPKTTSPFSGKSMSQLMEELTSPQMSQ